MKSMTGYGYREAAAARFQMSLEIKSYNNRYLDIFVNVPPPLSPLEPRIRDYLGSRIVRGKVEVFLKVKELEEDLEVRIDPATVKGYLKALKELSAYTEVQEEIRLSHLLRIDGLLKTDKNRDIEEYWTALLPLLEAVASEYEAARVREGEETKKDIERLLASVDDCVVGIETLVPSLEAYFKQTIRGRMEELLRDQVDETRLATEVALLLVKYSVNEEIVRLKAHLAAFRETLNAEGGVGKKLDFICQEINREINTVGSKSVLAEVNRHVVTVKDALENIREQIRNVE